jgi:lipoate-protein ligase A
MKMRGIDLGAVDAFTNNAQMAVLARSTAESGQPTLQTSVWGRTHLNVGWFDDVDDTLDLARCAELGVQVIRRPFAGGGTAFYDKGCSLMWGVLYPKGAGHDDLDAEIDRVKPIVLDALGRIGLGEVTFRGSADLRWERDRKLGGVSSGDFGKVVSVGGFLNIKPPNMDLYLQVVRVPDEKFKDKLVSDMREVVCTAQEVAGRDVAYEEFRDALFASARAAGIELVDQPLSEVEQAALVKISHRIASDDSVRRISSERFRAEAPPDTRVGLANHKGKKLCRAGLAVDPAGTIVAAMMAGDMHVSPPDAIERVAAALVGADAHDAGGLRARVSSVFDGPDIHQAEAMMGVTTDDLVAAVRKAVDAAERTL